ncbi:type I-E CRISPR-associated protein Cse1/CasA [Embleya sp. NPDC020886]|uniref:type I-E CRISPR-associated protein Cse1/CasA n=1 Tax=Embleya sp. NPDC020886 TaxID=3363980 RepID=UPI0037BC7DDC
MSGERCDGSRLGDGLSTAARVVWAKHDQKTDGWLPLWRHMADSAAVAGLLWDRWVPENVRRLVADALPRKGGDARLLVVWLAAVHDIGKATPAFACQVDSLADRMRSAGLGMPLRKQFGEDRRMAPHALAGQLLLQEWLADRHGWPGRAAVQFGIVPGGHHGAPPAHEQIHNLVAHPELLRTPGASEASWVRIQTELLDACADTYGVGDRLSDWRALKLPQPVQALLTGLVIIADWIASNPDLFPYFPEEHPRTDAERVAAAWRGLKLPPSWRAREPTEPTAELFASRFELPPGARVRPVQEEAVRLAGEMPVPGLLMIEAPMGDGKTEAALAVAEIFAARSGAGGCFVALPTMATGNAMFPRLLDWVERLPTDGDVSGERSVFLAHSKAALNEQYAGLMGRTGHTVAAVDQFGPQDVWRPSADVRGCSAELVAHQWLRGRKKGTLASFVVGTIDQLLMAGLKSRHLALRHLALAGKVVVIDEVHAYDTYMNTYLDRVLSWLGAYRVPVIMLSATLPASRRRELAEAYAGLSTERTPGAGPAAAAEEGFAALASIGGYPLLTSVSPGSAPETACPAASGRRTDVLLERLDDEPELLADRLAHELADGGCALVVRNTVNRVLETAAVLRRRFGTEHVTVAHSRFVDVDRADKDADLLVRFGPPDRKEGRPSGTTAKRPRGPHIVVASQVAEQSLDIDFDLLVTDLCPVDLMLQRMGRLHRHPRGENQDRRPPRLRTARCLVVGVDWQATPPRPVDGSRSVYGPYALMRSLAVLGPHMNEDGNSDDRFLCLPEDISGLVQGAYGSAPQGPDAWAAAMEEALADYEVRRARQRTAADAFRLDEVRKDGRPIIGWIDAGVGDADDTRAGRAQVRDSKESLEVLVVQRRADGTLTTLPWLGKGLGGRELPTDAVPLPAVARAVASCGLRLPHQFSWPQILDRAIAELEELCVPAWQTKECHWLAGELILVLDENCRSRLAGFELHYSRTDGLQVGNVAARNEQHIRMDVGPPSFDLVDRPWLPVQRSDGSEDELSLAEVFAQAGSLRRIVGDLPTQEFALLRLLLAIAHDAVDGPEDIDAWADLWESEDPFAAVPAYLDRHRTRFDLLHPSTPFYQVADLHTAKDEVASLNRIVADVPNGDPFFAMRMPGADRLDFAESARWLVHAHAFDVSGIKSGAVGDPRVKGGKGYPQGVGWAGNLGGVFAEGATLRETLLLNLIATDTGTIRADKDDRPAWRRDQHGPGATHSVEIVSRPSGVRDLYTWQSRRVRLHHDAQGVHGVVLSYGDPLAARDMHRNEPMTGWRRSRTQEKKLGLPLVYLPREHDPTRAAWRGLAALLPAGRERGIAEQRQDAASVISPRILDWVARLSTEGPLPGRRLIRTRIVGAVYGTQQSVIDEVVDDGVTMDVVLLHESDFRFGRAAVEAVADADAAVMALGDLATALAQAAGEESDPRRAAARDLGFGTLDRPFRHWLYHLRNGDDPLARRHEWQRQAHRIIADLGEELVDGAGDAAWEGRMVDAKGGPQWLTASLAHLRFRTRLNKALGHPFTPIPADTTTHTPEADA